MKQQLLGLVCAILFVLLSAIQGVYAGDMTQTISPLTLGFFTFFIVTFCSMIAVIVTHQFSLTFLKIHAKNILILNISTAIGWLGFLISVKYIEPAIAIIIISIVGPAFVTLFSPLVRPESKIFKIEKFSAICFISIFFYLIYFILSDKSSIRGNDLLDNTKGIVSALLSGLSISLFGIYVKKLFDKSVTILQSISFRFFLITLLTFFLAPKYEFH